MSCSEIYDTAGTKVWEEFKKKGTVRSGGRLLDSDQMSPVILFCAHANKKWHLHVI